MAQPQYTRGRRCGTMVKRHANGVMMLLRARFGRDKRQDAAAVRSALFRSGRVQDISVVGGCRSAEIDRPVMAPFTARLHHITDAEIGIRRRQNRRPVRRTVEPPVDHGIGAAAESQPMISPHCAHA